MITAKEALAITRKNAKKLAVRKYEPLILEAAKKGERSIDLDYWLSRLEIAALKELGYTISENDREFCSKGSTSIEW